MNIFNFWWIGSTVFSQSAFPVLIVWWYDGGGRGVGNQLIFCISVIKCTLIVRLIMKLFNFRWTTFGSKRRRIGFILTNWHQHHAVWRPTWELETSKQTIPLHCYFLSFPYIESYTTQVSRLTNVTSSKCVFFCECDFHTGVIYCWGIEVLVSSFEAKIRWVHDASLWNRLFLSLVTLLLSFSFFCWVEQWRITAYSLDVGWVYESTSFNVKCILHNILTLRMYWDL
jgi:hypothetical protein